MAINKAAKKQQPDGDDILREVVREDVEHGDAVYDVMTHDKPLTVRAVEDHLILSYQYGHDSMGTVAAMFDTFGFGDYMVEMCAGLLDEFLATASAKKTDGTRANLSELKLSEGAREAWVRELTRLAISAFIHHLQPKLSHALQEYEIEVGVIVRGWSE